MDKFEKLPENKREEYLLSFFLLAYKEPTELRKKWRTDIWGIAAQYGKSFGIKRKHYELFRKMTLEEIVSKIISD